MGSGGYAEVFEGYHHGTKRAFKMIPLNKNRHQFNTKSYGCHEYYYQENDLKQIEIIQMTKIYTQIKRSELMRDLVLWSTHR